MLEGDSKKKIILNFEIFLYFFLTLNRNTFPHFGKVLARTISIPLLLLASCDQDSSSLKIRQTFSMISSA
jgi:hypothetical protein